MPGMANRLSDVIDGQGWSRREFQRRIEGRGTDVKGTSYPSVAAYLDGKRDPPLEWLVRASEVLGVRAAWLAFGEGGRTKEEEAAMRARGRTGTWPRLTTEVEEAFREGFPGFVHLTPEYQCVLWTLWTFVSAEWPRAEGDDVEEGEGEEFLVQAAEAIGRALNTPLEALRVELEQVDDLALHLYVQDVCQGLMRLLPQDRIRQHLHSMARRRMELDTG